MNKKSLFFIFSFLLLLLLFPTNINPEEEKAETEISKKIEKTKKLFKKEEKVTIEDVEQLGSFEPIKEYPESMAKLFSHCRDYNTYCVSKVAGKYVYKTFTKKGSYAEKYPGQMIKGMAMYEILAHSKLKKNKKKLQRYRENWPKDYGFKKEKDEDAIRSLIKMNEGKEKMRSALGMTLDNSVEDAINRFWILGEFLSLGVPTKLGKLDSDVTKRKQLLQQYKATIMRLKEKLKEEEL